MTIDRVIMGDEVRLCRMNGVKILPTDTVNYDFSDASFTWASPARVWSESGEVIGSASLYRDENGVYADITIDYQSQERLSIETGQLLYAVPMGSIRLTFQKDILGTLEDFNPYNCMVSVWNVVISGIRVSPQTPHSVKDWLVLPA